MNINEKVCCFFQKKFFFLLFSIMLPIHAHSICVDSGFGSVNINFPSPVTIQSDMAVGSIIATGTATHMLTCIVNSESITLYPSESNISAGGSIGGGLADVVPSGITGIGIRWKNGGTLNGNVTMTTKALNNTSQTLNINANTIGLVNTLTEIVELVKTGPINIGNQTVSINPISVKQKGSVTNILGISAYRIYFNNITLRNAACTIEAQNQNISLGTVRTSNFSGTPSISDSITSFSINLKSCSKGTKVKMTLSNANAVVGYTGTIKLSGGSSAQNIGIQILDSKNKPFALGTQKSIENNVTTGFVSIPLKARYIKTSSSPIIPGTANGTLNFTIVYE